MSLMHRFRNILAVYDDAIGSDDTLARAVALSARTGARLTVVKPLGSNPRSTAAIAEARKRLTRITPWMLQEGANTIATDVLIGTPHVEVAERVLQQGHDLVILNAEAERGLKDVILGSTTANLMRKCPCAVWIVKQSASARNGAVIAAVDALPHEPARPINRKVLDFAVAVAQAQDANLHVVSSWKVCGNEADMLRSEIRDTTRQEILRKHETTQRDALTPLLERYGEWKLPIEVHLPHGAPQSSIVALANQLAVGLVVMGGACRAGMRALLKGNPAEDVLGGVGCDVLAVKPDDFRSSGSAS